MDAPLVIAGKEFQSRLMVGTGRHRSMEEMVSSIEASGAEIITVAIRRLDLDNPAEKNILDYFDWTRYTVLPNTAGCKTAEEAVFTARLAREVTGSDWIKLEVIPDARLLPDPVGTYEAAVQLIDEGFVVLPYIHADPVLAVKLEEIGCATVMPLGSAIGTGQGILTIDEIRLIIESASVPVVVDAGLAVPSEAAQAIEEGAGRGAGEHGHRPGQGRDADGRGLQAGRGSGPQGLRGRADRAQAGGRSQQPDDGCGLPVLLLRSDG